MEAKEKKGLNTIILKVSGSQVGWRLHKYNGNDLRFISRFSKGSSMGEKLLKYGYKDSKHTQVLRTLTVKFWEVSLSRNWIRDFLSFFFS